MAGCRRYLAFLGAALTLQTVAYGLNLPVLNAWPTPAVWFGLLVASAVATVGAAVWPSRETFALASFATLTTVGLRVVEIAYALHWGRLAELPDTARATGWVALTRDVTLLVCLVTVWAAVMRACAERSADAEVGRRAARPDLGGAVADPLDPVRRRRRSRRVGCPMAADGDAGRR